MYGNESKKDEAKAASSQGKRSVWDSMPKVMYQSPSPLWKKPPEETLPNIDSILDKAVKTVISRNESQAKESTSQAAEPRAKTYNHIILEKYANYLRKVEDEPKQDSSTSKIHDDAIRVKYGDQVIKDQLSQVEAEYRKIEESPCKVLSSEAFKPFGIRVTREGYVKFDDRLMSKVTDIPD